MLSIIILMKKMIVKACVVFKSKYSTHCYGMSVKKVTY